MIEETHNPSYYHDGNIECIDAIRSALGKEGFCYYCRGQAMKYLWRIGKKDAQHIEAHKTLMYTQWLYDTLCDMPLTKD
jgi:hypothetical protein